MAGRALGAVSTEFSRYYFCVRAIKVRFNKSNIVLKIMQKIPFPEHFW